MTDPAPLSKSTKTVVLGAAATELTSDHPNPTWVIGEGHMALNEARAHSVQQLANAEQAVIDQIEVLRKANRARTEAFAAEKRANDRLTELREHLALRQLDVVQRCGVIVRE